MDPCDLTATQAAARIAARTLSCEDLTRACLARIAAREPAIRAWACVDAEAAIARARALDAGAPAGGLRGLPVGFKDVIATADFPTSYNSPLYADHRPGADAACVAILKAAGCVTLGKTTTVEFAAGARKAPTRNPHDPGRTPGGSSSGSAAAVADRHVPVAIGGQTGGSVIRPAAYCGVYGFKPTHGLVGCAGVAPVAPTLDTIGWFARAAEDLWLVAEAFCFVSGALPGLARDAMRIGVLRGPLWGQADACAREAVEAAAGRLADAGFIVRDAPAAPFLDGLSEAAYRVIARECRASFLPELMTFGDALDPSLRDLATQGRDLAAGDALAAYDALAAARPAFGAWLDAAGLDAVLVPSAPGEAPEGLDGTGSSIMNTLWTALHGPCVNIPAGRGPNGLPIGVQLVGPRLADRRILAMAAATAPVVDAPPRS